MPRAHAPLLSILAAAFLGFSCAPAGRDPSQAESSSRAGYPPANAADSAFAATVAELSEEGGYFDTDNLVSNETSYLLAVSDIRAHGTHGGAYIGVGPDQSFSYIAATKPEVAYLIDIRRDNLAQHLLFRALFTEARNRAEYLLLLTGRELGDDVEAWSGRPLDELIAKVNSSFGLSDQERQQTRDRLLARAASFGVPLSPQDRAAMMQLLQSFATEGLELRFTTFGREPSPDYPTFRQLISGHDREGEPASYMATEEAFQTVKRMEQEGRVIPVVGDLAGPHALAAIGRDAAARGLTVSLLYVSNVEYYLMRDGTFGRFAATAASLPRDSTSLVIRSCFRRACGPAGPDAGSPSAQLVQPLDSMAAMTGRGGYRSYADLIRGSLPTAR